jgi:hypothetical protein
MFVVVRVDFSMALETNEDRVLYNVGAPLPRRDNVIRLRLYAAESVTDAAAAMDSDQQFVNVVSWKCHNLGAG